MSVMRTLRGKRTWIALGCAVLTAAALLALGALLMVKGVISQEMQRNWIFGSYGLAGLTGAWIGSERGKGTLSAALTVAALFLVVICAASLLFPEGGRFGAGGWQFALCILAGSLLGGVLRAGKKGRAPRRKRSPAVRRVPLKSR
ncbi:MAG: hypothetical protein J5482_05635 [Oscillospiraceae bacterium]|nr:hypothetical protein [Oscillospiraceae bacterium]